jgi:hypothetical protein
VADSDNILRLTIDFDAGCTAEEAKGVTEAVLGKIDQCWADTTSGPIHDDDGRHVGNALLEKLPVRLQLSHQLASAALLREQNRQLTELVCSMVPAIPRMGERPDFPDDYILQLRIKVGDLRAARRLVPALNPNANAEGR